MKIRVKREHIVAAEYLITADEWKCRTCPVAVALCCAGFGDVSVGTHSCRVDGDYYPLPQKAVSFISNFDNCKSVKPFTFELDLK